MAEILLKVDKHNRSNQIHRTNLCVQFRIYRCLAYAGQTNIGTLVWFIEDYWFIVDSV
jgi:hypothetical protein